jgi:hypothetical protein
MYVCVCMYICTVCIYAHTVVCIHTCVCTYICIYVCMFVFGNRPSGFVCTSNLAHFWLTDLIGFQGYITSHIHSLSSWRFRLRVSPNGLADRLVMCISVTLRRVTRWWATFACAVSSCLYDTRASSTAMHTHTVVHPSVTCACSALFKDDVLKSAHRASFRVRPYCRILISEFRLALLRQLEWNSHGDMDNHIPLTDRKLLCVISRKRSVSAVLLHYISYQVDLVPWPRLTLYMSCSEFFYLPVPVTSVGVSILAEL